jgi:hypothetical protein
MTTSSKKARVDNKLLAFRAVKLARAKGFEKSLPWNPLKYSLLTNCELT